MADRTRDTSSHHLINRFAAARPNRCPAFYRELQELEKPLEPQVRYTKRYRWPFSAKVR